MSTLGKIKRRLKDQAEYFRRQPESFRSHYRELYRVARDAVHHAQMLELEIESLRSPTLDQAPHAPAQEAPRYSRVEMMKAFIRAGDFSSREYLNFLKFTGLTHADAIQLVVPPPPV